MYGMTSHETGKVGKVKAAHPEENRKRTDKEK